MDACIRNVYITFILGLIILAGFILLYHRNSSRLPTNNIWIYIAVFIVSLILIFILGKMSFGIGKILISIIFLALLAYIFYPLVASLTSSELWKFVLITAIYFAILSIIVFILPISTFASWGNILFILLLLLIIFGIFGSILFRNSPQFRLVFYILILIVFSGLILYDTHRIANKCPQTDSINSALSLVLDAVNVFGATSGIGTL